MANMKDVAYPMQVMLVTCRGKAEVLGKESMKDNIIAISWHSPLSFDPELYGILIGKTRFSYKLIKESKVFAVNFVAHEMKDKLLQCGSSTGVAMDKFEKFGLTKEECETIDCCRLGEASAVLECEVIDEVETGDHVMFVGKVSKTHNRDDRKRLFHCGGDGFTSTL